MNFRTVFTLGLVTLVGVSSIPSTHAADDAMLASALRFSPKQKGIEYDLVEPANVEQCKASQEKRSGVKGLLVTGPQGQTLRWFADVNGDNNVDQWCYFLNNVEVYRESDTDGNKKPDQFRWLGTAGTRWGIDQNEDGIIDRWKSISAQEVTAEAIDAIRFKDANRFRALLLDANELKQLGLGEDKFDALKLRVEQAIQTFDEVVKAQKAITETTRWAHFEADKPGIVPAGTNGSTKDLQAYENVIALVEDTKSGKNQQVLIGTLVAVENSWRLLDSPRTVSDETVFQNEGLFFAASASGSSLATKGMPAETEKLFNALDAISKKIDAAPADRRSSLHSDRADILEKLITSASTADELEQFVKQFTNDITSAAQSNEYPEGVQRLTRLIASLDRFTKDKNLKSFVVFRTFLAEHAVEIVKPDANVQTLEEAHIKNLNDFVQEYPTSPDAGEAMVLIGLTSELAGDPKDAEKWYRKAAALAPDSPQGKKAAGAVIRLNLQGQTLALQGKTLDGKNFDGSQLKRKPIVVHYWASWCAPCKNDMLKLRQLQAKYVRDGLTIVGINMDSSAVDAKNFLKTEGKNFPWPHIFEEGGMDNSFATQLGVFSLPVTFVIDGNGVVAHSGTHYSQQLESTVESLIGAANTPAKKK